MAGRTIDNREVVMLCSDTDTIDEEVSLVPGHLLDADPLSYEYESYLEA